MVFDFKKIEKKWQDRWEREKAFQPRRDAKKKKVLMTVPYPYTSGPLHIGHGRTYTIADIWVRHKRMQGYNALWPMAFHISGTPIEAVSKKVRDGDRKTLELYREYVGLYEKDKKEIERIIESFRDPWNVANFFADVIEQDFRKLGFSIDWSRQFTTGDPEYNAFVSWQFSRLRGMGLVTKGEHPVQFCPTCNSAVGEDDIRDGDILDTGIKAFTAVKFPFEDGFLVAATLRPETIYGVTNLWVNPEGEYLKVDVNGEILYLSKEAAEKIGYQMDGVKIIGEVKAGHLLGKRAESPVGKRSMPILPAGFVDTSNGTGIVYSVPAHAPFDYAALEEARKDKKWQKVAKDVKPISVIKLEGFGDFPAKEMIDKTGTSPEKLEHATKALYREEFYRGVLKGSGGFSGIAIKNIKDDFRNWLKKEGKAMDFFESNTPGLVCRDGTRVFVKVIKDQWFIDYGNREWKAKAMGCLQGMGILPEEYRKHFEHTISWLHERAAARKRGLGTRLPWDSEWVIESLSDSTIYPAFYTVVKEMRKSKLGLNNEFFDYVFLGKGKLKEADSIRKEFEYWYPVDLRHTAVAHVTNHLTFYIFNHAAIFPEKYWPKAITLNELLIREGAKMSKSRGNVIPLADISEKYGADLYRLYIASGADLGSVVDWTEENVQMVRKRLARFLEIAADIITNKGMGGKGENIPDKWILSRFNRVLHETGGLIDSMRIRDFAQKAFFEVMNDIGYYLRRAEKPLDYAVLDRVLRGWIRLLSPIMPHTCEELWEMQGNSGLASLAAWPEADPKAISEEAEMAEGLVGKTVGDVNEIIKIVGKKPREIKVYCSPAWKYRAYEIARKMDDRSGLIKELMKNEEIRKQGNNAVKYAESLRKLGALKGILPERDEFDALKGAEKFFSKEFGCGVSVIRAGESGSEKALRAEPGKPGIEIAA
ncbi:MAG: leucine--tRNA ligase [Candidatus Aenigmarchaeota archaeon]|nr:leucine--tRNA ligase [Candidatus Aenigmarchaeota archaeon]